MAESRPPTTQPIHPEVRFEHSDIRSRNVIFLAAGTLVGAWIFAWLLYYFFAFLVHYRDQAGAPPPERSIGKTFVPPEPRLEVSPTADLRQLRASEDAQLTTYGWIDRAHGMVRIPIEKAIEITAQRGIPPIRSQLKVCDKQAEREAGVGGSADPMTICPPKAGTRETGFEGKVEPEPR